MISKMKAKRIAKGILSLDGIDAIVCGQIETYPYTDGMSMAEKEMIIAAASEIAQELYEAAGKETDHLINSLPNYERNK